jgi:hypothetical protein
MDNVTPFPGATESAFVRRLPLVGVVRGLAYADRAAVQAGAVPVMIHGSLDGERWHMLHYAEALSGCRHGGA